MLISIPFWTSPTSVPKNQHQSAKRDALAPVLGPIRPSLDNVAISSDKPLTRSRRTGGGAARSAWKNGCERREAVNDKGTGFFVGRVWARKDESREAYGTLFCARIVLKGASQSNKRSIFL